MAILGIDPGKGGGMAVLLPGGEIHAVAKMPKTMHGFWRWLTTDASPLFTRIERAYVENVHASPQMGVVSAFTFGRGYGAVLMALAASNIPVVFVTPQQWQGALACRSGGDKNITKARATALFPEIEITHALADALLIAEFGRRVTMGLPPHHHRTGKHGEKETVRKKRTRFRAQKKDRR